jgi:hypothetical protein
VLLLNLCGLIPECVLKLGYDSFLKHSFIIHYSAVVLLYIVQVTDIVVK